MKKYHQIYYLKKSSNLLFENIFWTFICDGGAGLGGCGGSSAAVERAGEGAVGRRRRIEIWRRGIAIEMEGDRDRVSMKFKNIHEFKKCP